MTLAIAVLMGCTCIAIVFFEAGREQGRREQHHADQSAHELDLVAQAKGRHPSSRRAAA